MGDQDLDEKTNSQERYKFIYAMRRFLELSGCDGCAFFEYKYCIDQIDIDIPCAECDDAFMSTLLESDGRVYHTPFITKRDARTGSFPVYIDQSMVKTHEKPVKGRLFAGPIRRQQETEDEDWNIILSSSE